MRKFLVAILLLLVWGANPPRAQANTVTDRVSITFIANPDLPKEPAPGLPAGPPGGNPIITQVPHGTLPKTGETQTNLFPIGFSLLLMALMLYFTKKSYAKQKLT